MELVVFSLQNYRRFVEKTSIKLHAGVVAIVGPNEAGKSSLLDAIKLLGSDEPYEKNEATRRQPKMPTLWWQLQLDDDDRALIADIHDTHHIRKAIVEKEPSGKRSWSFEPRNPARDRSPRDDARDLLADLEQFDVYGNDLLDEQMGPDREALTEVTDLLNATEETLDASEIATLQRFASSLRSVLGEHSDDERIAPAQYLTSVTAACDTLDDLCATEASPSPSEQVRELLESRLPEFVQFTTNDRDLRSEYDLQEVADDPPSALEHLAALARLNLTALRDEAIGSQIGDLATRRNAANAHLLSAFAASWNQQEIAIQFEVHGTILHIQATTPSDKGLSSISERSDGMRWFAALLAFINGWPDRPILLADEIETHLHYDAQSDLVNVLTKQEFTSKVIYTTHSFGSLPNDLGNGVRAVIQIDQARSQISNDFWSSGAGFTPLLASMGAAAVSFTPSRRAVIGEGACEAILLPTLLRQASGLSKLEFQVVPGLAVVSVVGVAELKAQAGHVAYFVDGDGGGKNVEAKLLKGGADPDAIVVLRDDDGSHWELEDLVDPSAYLEALNAEIALWGGESSPKITASDLPGSLTTKAVAAWCKKNKIPVPDKTPVAQRIVEIAAERSAETPVRLVISEVHRDRLNAIATRFNEILKVN